MTAKKALRRLVRKGLNKINPIGFYSLVQKFYLPPQNLIPKLTFHGLFNIDISGIAQAKLYNSAFPIETILFWQGFNSSSWELTSRKIWVELVKTQGVILDIGANSGIYSIIAKAINPLNRVIAFEPQPNIYEALLKNINANSFNIEAENYALSNQKGILPFYNFGEDSFTDYNTTAGSLNKDWNTNEQVSIDVEVKLLSEVLISKKIEKVDLIKIDVETYEIQVLEGYGSLFFDHRPILLIEVQNNEIGSQLNTMLNGKNYLYYQINEGIGIEKKVEITPNNATSKDYVNYVLIPQEKDYLISSLSL